MNGRYSNLTLVILLDPEERQKFGHGYKYLVYANGFQSHHAYYTKAGLMRFLRDTGLRLVGRRAPHMRSVDLAGAYHSISLMDESTFAEMRASGNYRETIVLSNGDYTTGLVEEGDENRIYYLNPNCHGRDVYDWREQPQ